MSATYLDLENIVLAYLQQTLPINDPFVGNVSSEDRLVVIKNCILRGANNARKWIEKKNNWVRNEVVADISIPAGEWVELAGLTDTMTGKMFRMNTLTEIYHMTDGKQACEPFPLAHYRTLSKMQTKFAYLNRVHATVWNNKISLVAPQNKAYDFRLYGYRWLDDYYAQNMYSVNGADVPDYNGNYYVVGTENERIVATRDGVPYTGSEPALWYDSDRWFLMGVSPVNWRSAFTSVLTPDLVPAWTSPDGATGTITVTPGVAEINDWILTDGFDVLQWATICEVNHLIQTFVPRQEGSLPPPTASRDDALMTLLDWDADLKDAQFNTLVQ